MYNLQQSCEVRRDIVIIPRSVYLKIITLNFNEVDTSKDIPAIIYEKCDTLLGVKFITVVHITERAFKCAIIDNKKWCLSRLKYGI